MDLEIEKQLEFENNGIKLHIIFIKPSVREVEQLIGIAEFSEIVRETWASSKNARLYPILEILVFKNKGYGNDPHAVSVDPQKTMAGKYRISLNFEELVQLLSMQKLANYYLLARNKAGFAVIFRQSFPGILAEELAHMKIDLKNRLMAVRRTAMKKVMAADREQSRLAKHRKDINFPHYKLDRMNFFNIIEKFQREGIAEYCKEIELGFCSDLAKKEKELLKRTKRKLKVARLMEQMSSFTDFSVIESIKIGQREKVVQDLGYHMALTLILHIGMNEEQLMGMSPLDFIRQYEAAAKKCGFPPRVSLSSGKGYFDYKRALENLSRIYSGLQKNQAFDGHGSHFGHGH